MTSRPADNWWEHGEKLPHSRVKDTPDTELVPWWQDTADRLQTVSLLKTEPTFPSGKDNPYYDFACRALESFENLDLSGHATVITPQWNYWYDSGSRAWAHRGRGSEPEKFRQVSYDEIAHRGFGWKVHLNFDAEDPKKISIVGTFLSALEEVGVVTAFKIGQGGGKSEGAPGKEATVYVGHRDKAELVAPVLESGLAGVLDQAEGDTLHDDMPFTNKVWGRFQIDRIDPSFHQYGPGGHPLLNEDIMQSVTWHTLDDKTSDRLRDESIARADTILKERFGVFYTGSKQTSRLSSGS